jgi:hypothetical protein
MMIRLRGKPPVHYPNPSGQYVCMKCVLHSAVCVLPPAALLLASQAAHALP